MNETDWNGYGVGNNPKCANCMVHCGFEPTAVDDAVARPLKSLWRAIRGPRTEGPMAPEPELRYDADGASRVELKVAGGASTEKRRRVA